MKQSSNIQQMSKVIIPEAQIGFGDSIQLSGFQSQLNQVQGQGQGRDQNESNNNRGYYNRNYNNDYRRSNQQGQYNDRGRYNRTYTSNENINQEYQSQQQNPNENGNSNSNYNGNNNNYNRSYQQGDRRYQNNRDHPFNNNRRGPFRNNNNPHFNYNNNNNRFENNSSANFFNNSRQQPEDSSFINKYRTEIDLIRSSFPNLQEKDCIDILKRLEQNTAQTIFESLNEIAKENFCKKINNGGLLFFNMDIFETKDLKYLQDTHEQMLKYYKVYKSTDNDAIQGLPDYYYYINESERRRKLRKNEEGVYSYIPVTCTDKHSDTASKDRCYYAHTDNEINYHSLMYHTKICRKKECKLLNGLCSDSHGIEEDFRLIYNYQLREICLLMNKLSLKLPKVDQYEKYLLKGNQFNLSSFKVTKCFYGVNCNLNYHLCLNYHKDEERRRPPLLFRYTYEKCKDAIEDDHLNPQLCELGEYCPYIHRVYEYNYHDKLFRRLVDCTMLREEGLCPYIETCYKMHNKVNNEEYEEKKERLSMYKGIIDKLRCPNCQSGDKNHWYALLKCTHFLCGKCFEKARKAKKCLICEMEVSKGKNYNIIMNLPLELKTSDESNNTSNTAKEKEEEQKKESREEAN